MPSPDEIGAAARDAATQYGQEQKTLGAASRQPELDALAAQERADVSTIADLRAQVTLLLAVIASTTPDYPEVTTEADLRAAIAGGSPVTVNTTIQANSPLKVPTLGAAIYLGPSGYIERNFDNPGGATKQSLFVNADWTQPIQGFEITGPGKLGSAGGIHGNIIGVWADDIYFRDWSVDYWTGGRLFIGGGERQNVARITARAAEGSGSGVGGWRVSLGSGVIADCDIECGDDVLQGVCAGGKGDPLRNLGDIHDLTYRNCTGRSFTARFMVLGLQGEAMTASIRGVRFEGCHGFGGGTGVNIANHAPSSGSITAVTFADCTVDQSLAGSTGQPGDVFVLREDGTGVVDDIDLSGLTVLNPKRRSMYATKDSTAFPIGSNIKPPVAA